MAKHKEERVAPPVEAPAGETGADGEGADGHGEGDGKGGKKKLIIIILLALILLGGGGGAAVFLLGHKKPAAEAPKDANGNEVKLDKDGKPIVPGAYFLQIPDILVNLSSADGQNRYLRLSVQLEVGSEEDKKAVENVMPRVVDQFQTYLRELRVKDLRGSAGIYRLQVELLSRVNAAAAPTQVKNVLFQEILIQ